jgi:uncharacterized protein YjbI with pentapeptide repeats
MLPRNTRMRIRTIQDLERATRLPNGSYNLYNADLQEAILRNANLQGADLVLVKRCIRW